MANPSAKEILALMVKMGVPYAAHEFFNAHWQPMYFGDVVEEAAEHDLRFVGQLPLHLNFRDLATAPPLKEASQSHADRRAWERMRAFATNEFFRRDVYVKGGPPRGENTTLAYLDATPFGTLVAADEVIRDLPLPGGSLHFTGPLFEALIAALARRSSTLSDLAAESSLAAFGADRIRQALLQVVMGKDVIPMALSSEGIGGVGSRHRVPSPFNRAVLTQALSRRSAVTLASPVAGTGIALSMLDAIALQATTLPRPEERAAWDPRARGRQSATPRRSRPPHRGQGGSRAKPRLPTWMPSPGRGCPSSSTSASWRPRVIRERGGARGAGVFVHGSLLKIRVGFTSVGAGPARGEHRG